MDQNWIKIPKIEWMDKIEGEISKKKLTTNKDWIFSSSKQKFQTPVFD